MSDVMITVRGEHETRIAPEEAVGRLSVRAEGPERGDVVERIAALTAPVGEDLIARAEAGTISDWSSERVSLWSNRPWNSEGRQLAPVHYASVDITATFTDFAALSWWIGEVSERDGVQVDGIVWRLTPQTRRDTEAAVATLAVRVAVERATAYAGAIGLERVTPVEIADLGLLTRGEAPGARPEMMRAVAASFSADAAGGAPAMDFNPDDIVVSAAVEARFRAS